MTPDPFYALSDKLNELQRELMRREWPEDRWERIDRAADFSRELWEAIVAYRNSYRDLPR